MPKTNPPVSIEKDLRPISLTPVVSKILEGFVYKWLWAIVKSKIDSNQFGGVPASSTVDALVSLYHEWSKQTDRPSNYVRILMIDYRKAFDHIDHSIIIQKLESLGVHMCLVNWVHSFLCDRQMKVSISGHESEWMSPNGGVPQGTKLGPLLFIILINDLNPALPTAKFVDDTTVHESFSQPVQSSLQNSTDTILNWSSTNQMKLNASKTKEMLVCFKRKPEVIPPIVIENQPIERVSVTKLLGVNISANLSWNEHVDTICAKASQRTYLLYILKRSGLDPKEIITVFCSTVRPILEYACQVWHTCLTQECSDKIEKIQRRACRILSPHLTYSEALTYFKLRKLSDRRETLCKEYFTKVLRPDHKLHHLLPSARPVHYSLRHTPVLPTPNIRTERHRKSFIPYALRHFQ